MSLTVDVLGVEPLPVVRLRVETTGTWSVHGATASGQTWKVADGSGDLWLSDPWAPLGLNVWYEMRTDDGREVAGPVQRPSQYRNVLAALEGRAAVPFAWHPSPGNPRTYEPRAKFFDVPGSALPAFTAAGSAGVGGGSLAIRTVPPHTQTVEDLVLANGTVLILHNEGLCPVLNCDIPLAQTVQLTGAGQDRRPPTSERVWDLSYRLVPAPWGFRPPVALVADYGRRWESVADIKASGLTVGELASGRWLEWGP